MYYALNSNKERVYIVNTKVGEEYYCPICGDKLIQKKGDVKAWHFSHSTKSNCDDWYGMSKWHSQWQNAFPEKYREIIVEKDNIKHRADIKIDNLIVEFQNSSLAGYNFDCRNDFYTSIGKLVWVFNLRGKNIHDRYWMKGKTTQYLWDWAYKLNNLEAYGTKFDLFFQIKDDLLVKVIWNKQGFKYFGGYKYTKEDFMNYLYYEYIV